MEYAVALVVLLALAGLFVAAPFARGRAETEDRRAADRRAELEAAKEAKYREIRDAEMDFRMGKVSEADHRATDRELRAEAIEILRELDRVEGREAGEGGNPGSDGQQRPPQQSRRG